MGFLMQRRGEGRSSKGLMLALTGYRSFDASFLLQLKVMGIVPHCLR